MYIAIAVGSSGDNTIIPAQGNNKKIVLKELFLAGKGDVNGHIKSNTGVNGTVHFASLAKQFPFTSGTGFVLNGIDRRWEGDENVPMVLNLSAAIDVVGYARFEVEPVVVGEG